MYHKSLRTWLFIVYLMMMIYLSLMTGNELKWFSQLWKYDKTVHFMEYVGLGFLMVNMLLIHPMKKIHWNLTILFLLLFPILDESLQYFSPTRISDLYDGIFDIMGGLTGAYIRKKI